MKFMTVEAIRLNPWNALKYPLPETADRQLLRTAMLALHYGANSEFDLMLAAREGDYVPEGWVDDVSSPDIHEVNEYRSLVALEKLEKLMAMYRPKFGKWRFVE